MNTGMVLLVITVITALIFDFLNGFHDAANSIATVVSTRVLSPKLAGRLGRRVQLSRRLFPRHRRCQDHWQGHDPSRHRHPIRRYRRTLRRHRLGLASPGGGDFQLLPRTR